MVLKGSNSLTHTRASVRWIELAQESLDRHLAQLREAYPKFPFPSVRIAYFARAADAKSDVLSLVSHLPNSLHPRVVLSDAPLADGGTRADRERLRISHLVSIFAGENGTAHDGSGLTSLTQTVPNQYVDKAIHDVAMDVALFHAWPGLLDRFAATVRLAIAFSERKANFIRSRGLALPWGTLPIGAEYGSIASVARLPNGTLELRRLWQLWQEFLTEQVLATGESLENLRAPSSVQVQLSRFKKVYGQLSPRAIDRAVAKLDEGCWVLVVLRHAPGKHARTLRASLTQYFGKRAFRMNLLRFITLEEWESRTPRFVVDHCEAFKVVV